MKRSRRPSSRSGQSRRADESSDTLHLKAVSDRLIVAASGELLGPDVLVILLNGTTLATGLREARSDFNYTFYTPEHFFFTTLQTFHPECRLVSDSLQLPTRMMCEGTSLSGGTSLRLVCAADPPEEEFDSIAFPTNAIGSSEQTQELLQICHQRLRTGGRLVVATNNPKDKWLHAQLREIFDKVTVSGQRDGVVYIARKQTVLKKVRDFHATFAFRFHDQLVQMRSRPGVFSHRRVDGGARALIRSLDLLRTSQDATSPEFTATRIADVGCGSGAVSVAAALQYPQARVLAVDSFTRALESTALSAEANQIDRVDLLLASDAALPDPGTWDLFLTNPPYYSDYRISELFLQSARTALKSGGRIHLVTKLTDWHQSRLDQLFREIQVHRIGEYDVLTACKR